MSTVSKQTAAAAGQAALAAKFESEGERRAYMRSLAQRGNANRLVLTSDEREALVRIGSPPGTASRSTPKARPAVAGRQGRPAGWRPADEAARFNIEDEPIVPPVEYRSPPEFIPTGSIIHELRIHIADVVTWSGPIGEYARARAAALHAELRRREGAA